MITYRATLDVPAEAVRIVSSWLLAHRRAHDVRPWQRAATPYVQAVMVLRWFKEATDLRILARDPQSASPPFMGTCTTCGSGSVRLEPGGSAPLANMSAHSMLAPSMSLTYCSARAAAEGQPAIRSLPRLIREPSG